MQAGSIATPRTQWHEYAYILNSVYVATDGSTFYDEKLQRVGLFFGDAHVNSEG